MMTWLRRFTTSAFTVAERERERERERTRERAREGERERERERKSFAQPPHSR
jgi:hypothetical protein